jgi:6-phosphogluconate dehydrogenase
MVHNGIEYADMQCIAEAYDLLRRLGGIEPLRLAEIFYEWNRGPLESFLIEITAKIFTVKDPIAGGFLVDKVLDQAGQKGTGRWTAQVALDLAVAIPSIAAAIDSRVLSARRDERLVAATTLAGPAAAPPEGDERNFVHAVHDALHASKMCAYAQGMALIAAGSRAYGWSIDLKEIARIWKGGCIIRARFLDAIMTAYERAPDLPNLLLDEHFRDAIAAAQEPWRRVVSLAVAAGVPTPAMSASIAYYDSYRARSLPANLIQAQRDAFGSHTYERSDAPEQGFVHTDWLGDR